MPRNLTLISVRLDPSTVHLLNALTQNQTPLQLNRHPHPRAKKLSRSAIIRHAVTAGLDVLTDEPPLQLTEPKRCRTSATNRPTTSDDPVTA